MSTYHARLEALLIALLLAGCGSDTTSDVFATPGPQLVIPPGVTSNQTPEQVVIRMRAEIALNERKLGRALAPVRIIRVQLLREGEMFMARRLDGSLDPSGRGMGPDGGAGWVVEAIGTFIGEGPAEGQTGSLGIHGFHLWHDTGGETMTFIPCWNFRPLPAAEMDGQCEGP